MFPPGFAVLSGNLDNTFPNPALRRVRADDSETESAGDVPLVGDELVGEGGEEGGPGYHPAFLLSDWSLERAGRGARTLDSLACELKYDALSVAKVPV